MKPYEKIFKDLKALYGLQLNEFVKQFDKSGGDPDDLLGDEVEDFLINTINKNIEDLRDNTKAMNALVAIFMMMFINKIEADFTEPEEKEVD